MPPLFMVRGPIIIDDEKQANNRVCWSSCRYLHMYFAPQQPYVDVPSLPAATNDMCRLPCVTSLIVWTTNECRQSYYLPSSSSIPLLTHVTTIEMSSSPPWCISMSIKPPSSASSAVVADADDTSLYLDALDDYRRTVIGLNDIYGNMDKPLQKPDDRNTVMVASYPHLQSLILSSPNHVFGYYDTKPIHRNGGEPAVKEWCVPCLRYLSLARTTPAVHWSRIITTAGSSLLSLYDISLGVSDVEQLLQHCSSLQRLSLKQFYRHEGRAILHAIGRHFTTLAQRRGIEMDSNTSTNSSSNDNDDTKSHNIASPSRQSLSHLTIDRGRGNNGVDTANYLTGSWLSLSSLTSLSSLNIIGYDHNNDDTAMVYLDHHARSKTVANREQLAEIVTLVETLATKSGELRYINGIPYHQWLLKPSLL